MSVPTAKAGALVLLIAVALAGCGMRSNLEYPNEAKTKDTATAESGQGKPEGAGHGSHKPFILDGLIR